MRSHPGSRPLRTALSTLAVSAALMLGLMAALQFFPHWRESLGLKAENAVQQNDTHVDPDDDIDRTDGSVTDHFSDPTAFSGSVVGGKAQVASERPAGASGHHVSTIDMTEDGSFDDSIPLPPTSDGDPLVSPNSVAQVPAEEIGRLERQLAELEQRIEKTQRKSASQESVRADAFQALRAQWESRADEWKAISSRLEQTERQLEKLESSWRTSQAEHSPETSSRISIRVLEGVEGRLLVMEARDASLPELLVRLGEATGVNLVVSPEVTGTVSLRLNLPEADDALETICKTHACQIERSGSFVRISPAGGKTAAVVPPPPPETITKLYRLQHLSGSEIRPYVQAMLTPGLGTVNFASIRERVARTVYRDPPRAILVKDTPQVIADVDRLILELDRRPARGKELPRPGAMPDGADMSAPPLMPAAAAIPSSPVPIELFEPPVHGVPEQAR